MDHAVDLCVLGHLSDLGEEMLELLGTDKIVLVNVEDLERLPQHVLVEMHAALSKPLSICLVQRLLPLLCLHVGLPELDLRRLVARRRHGLGDAWRHRGLFPQCEFLSHLGVHEGRLGVILLGVLRHLVIHRRWGEAHLRQRRRADIEILLGPAGRWQGCRSCLFLLPLGLVLLAGCLALLPAGRHPGRGARRRTATAVGLARGLPSSLCFHRRSHQDGR
mmetsp:Transcript_47648/g.101962  ORF Transcript_47648/g.101962 Transcript_47648/m.101962 type:complete len:220 (+) Transcript_47648:243-902(+)